MTDLADYGCGEDDGGTLVSVVEGELVLRARKLIGKDL